MKLNYQLTQCLNMKLKKKIKKRAKKKKTRGNQIYPGKLVTQVMR
jgi:hypothetical protein